MNIQKESMELEKQLWRKKHYCDPKFCTVLVMCGVQWISSAGYTNG